MARLLVLLVAVTAFWVPATQDASAATAHYNPRPGVTFNSPLGAAPVRRAIFGKIIRSINGTPRGAQIKIFSWNFLTREGTDALLRAQRRHVMVRLLMDKSNNTEIPNQPYRRLRAGLRAWNANHPKQVKSWARTCKFSCRGRAGAAHSKFYLFSKVGRTPHVVIQGSANLTVASTSNQWNDIYTYTRNRAVYRFADHVFAQAVRDKAAHPTYAAKSFGTSRLIMFPLGSHRDPVMDLLNKVHCNGATNTRSHRTVIRIAPDVLRERRGMRLAQKVRYLWNHGCDVHIGYTVVGLDVGRMLRSSGGRGPVPMKHLVQDFNGDGEFDNYFHLKAMTIVGNVGKDRSSWVTLNGSANWSDRSARSDENLGIFWSKNVTQRYQDHLNYWYDNFPHSASSSRTNARMATGAPAGSSSQLVFGTGPDAVYEDGTPYSSSGVDPYANLELD